MTARRVFVTGGNGFLGTSVVAGLAAIGLQVTSADIRSPIHHDSGVDYVIANVTEPEAIAVAMEGHDTVVHLASIVNPGKGSTREHEYRVDVDGSRNVLQACVRLGIRRIVVSSSGAAYGYHADNPAWLTEDDALRGNDAFAYSRHKRLVEEMLVRYRHSNPELEQTILRIGTILGTSVDNQITALFEKKRLLRIAGADSPFVFIWDEDLVAIVIQAVTGERSGVFNVAGDGSMTMKEIAAALNKPTLPIPEIILRNILAVAKPLGLTPYGPEQTKFLQFRPLLLNRALKETFGYTPRMTTRDAFDAWKEAHGH